MKPLYKELETQADLMWFEMALQDGNATLKPALVRRVRWLTLPGPNASGER